MQSRLIPYLSFRDNAREAMEFYHTIFGGKLDFTTFKESGVSTDPSDDDKIMHASLETEGGIIFMAADTPHTMQYEPGKSISMTLGGDNEAELTDYFNKLAEGGTIEAPLTKATWGDIFGMLTDKFGIRWMVNIAAPKTEEA